MLLALAAFSMLLLPTLTTLLLLKPGTHTPLTWSLVTCTPQHNPLETRFYKYGKIEDIRAIIILFVQVSNRNENSLKSNFLPQKVHIFFMCNVPVVK